MNKEQVLDRVFKTAAVAVVRLKEPEKLIKVSEAIKLGGIDIIEITMTVPNAIEQIKILTDEMGNELVVGVGSVLNKETAEKAVDAGAKYVVSPIVKADIISTARDMGVPVMPGAFTPTEIQFAFEEGADIVKVFPADNLGMQYFKNVLAPMPHLKLMPTGGVSLTNAGDWLAAGACAVGVGSALLDKVAIEEENYSQLTENAQLLMTSINNFREKNHTVKS